MAPEEIFENKYRIGELLGEGGMGVVHAAVHVYSGAYVAIKRIPKAVAERGALGERLMRESKVLALLIQANIVRLLDCGETAEGDIYLIMERVDGDTLRALIQRVTKKKRTLDLGLALHVIAQAAEAMEFAHHKGVCHRDLKPENIMVSKSGHAKVLDFGLAKSPTGGAATAANPTRPGNVVGTPRYMAPEQVRGHAADGRADIYTLGIVLYEAISGRTPYDEGEDETPTLTEIMGHHIFAEPRPLREVVPDCPDHVWSIVTRCLAKDPNDRFAEMADLASAIRRSEELVWAERDARRKQPEVAAREAQRERFVPREVRVTEPMPESFQPGAALPFLPSSFLRREEAPREVRVTEPMPASLSPARALPFLPPPAPERLGRGHTLKIPALREAEPREAPPRVAALVAAAQSVAAPVELAAGDQQDAQREGSARSGPGFAFEPTWPEAQARRESPAAAEVSLPVPRAPQHPRNAPTMKTPPYYFAPFGGLVLAAFGLVALMTIHTRRGVSPAPSVEPPRAVAAAPRASASDAPPAATQDPVAAPPSLPPEVPAESPKEEPRKVAIVAPIASADPLVLPPAPTSSPRAITAGEVPRRPPRPTQSASPAPAASNYVPLFSMPEEKRANATSPIAGVKK